MEPEPHTPQKRGPQLFPDAQLRRQSLDRDLPGRICGDREALGKIFSDPDKFYAAAPYTFLFASLIVLIFGPGKFSLDAMLTRKFADKK